LGSRVRIPSPAPKKPNENQTLSTLGEKLSELFATEQYAKLHEKDGLTRAKSVQCCSRAVRPGADPPDKKKAAPDGDQGAATSKATAANKSHCRAAALQARFVPLNKMQRAWIEPPKRVRSRRARYHQEPKRPWVRLFLDVLEHDAYRGLSINARRAYDALVCHLHRSGSIENGSLDVSHKTFETFGVTHRYVASALRELEDARLIWSSRAEQKHPLLPAAKRYGVTTYADETKRAFAWVYLDFLESKSYRGLSINARRVLERLLIENTMHRYKANGLLRVSARQFGQHGVNTRFTCGAIRELEKARLLGVIKGKPNGKYAAANLYRLKFLGTVDGPATWRRSQAEKTIFTTQMYDTTATQMYDMRKSVATAGPSGQPAKIGHQKRSKCTTSITSWVEMAPFGSACQKSRQKPDPEPGKEQVAFFCAKSAVNFGDNSSRLTRTVLAELAPVGYGESMERKRETENARRPGPGEPKARGAAREVASPICTAEVARGDGCARSVTERVCGAGGAFRTGAPGGLGRRQTALARDG
jgi:hypothetical protein